ncbi:hypothetical protein ABTX85_01740 [Streptomyces sp. NPDC096097]|uniref:hypothetical protein n=1 Tax=Streptomyces sp. NPDC096097 TaxID=3155546 RepID=UPI0033233518
MRESADRHRHIDRAEQLEDAARLTARGTEGDGAGHRERQGLFFEGPQGIGKSSLLWEIYERHAADGAYFLDLPRIPAEHHVLESLAMQARRNQVNVPSYESTRTRFAEQSAQTHVDFNNVRIRNGTFQLLAAAQDRTLQTASLSDALLGNLVADARRPVICLDGFEACAQPMRDWLGRSLLPNLLSRREISVFVAGRQLPSLTRPYAGSVRTLALPPFDVAAVHEWIESLGIVGLKDEAAAIQQVHGGIPELLDEFFKLHIESAEAGAGYAPGGPDDGREG